MDLVETVKSVFTTHERAVYECAACGAVFQVDHDEPDPGCPECESPDVTLVNTL